MMNISDTKRKVISVVSILTIIIMFYTDTGTHILRILIALFIAFCVLLEIAFWIENKIKK